MAIEIVDFPIKNGGSFHSIRIRHLKCHVVKIAAGKLASGKHTENYGKSPFFMGKSTISMVMFNSYVKLPEGR